MLWRDHNPRRRTWWGEIWRMLLAAWIGVFTWSFIIFTEEEAGITPNEGLWFLDLLLGVFAVLLLPLRRRWPLPISLLSAAMTSVSAFAVPAAGIALVSLATHRRLRPVLVVGVLWFLSGLAFELLRPPEAESNAVVSVTVGLVVSLLTLGVATLTGFNIGAQRELQTSWRDRAQTAEREQASRVSEARATERARIAREMHDVLAHRISLISMHSGALAYRKDLSPEETTKTAELIRDTSHQALAELREILGVLRSAESLGAGEVEAPQPTLTGLGDLLARERQAGAEVSADISLPNLDVMPTALSRNAFRIVQEALTNARKHAPAAPVRLKVTGEPGAAVEIEVRNPVAPTPGATVLPTSGLGLAGLTERAMLSGGDLRFGRERDGHFVVRARLPWPS